MEVLGSKNCGELLGSALRDKIRRNPRFSLQAFAAQLELAPSHLSNIIRRKKNLSRGTALRVAQRLQLKPGETRYFCALAGVESARTEKERRRRCDELHAIAKGIENVHALELDRFEVIASWYHLAILHLSFVTGGVLDPSAVAERLGIRADEASDAIERLLRVELLEEAAPGRYRATQSRTMTASEVPHRALRRFNREMLLKAISENESDRGEERFFGTETVPFDCAQLPLAKALCDHFLNSLTELATRSGKKEAVYHLGVQFFPLARPIKRSSR